MKRKETDLDVIFSSEKNIARPGRSASFRTGICSRGSHVQALVMISAAALIRGDSWTDLAGNTGRYQIIRQHIPSIMSDAEGKYLTLTHA